MANFCPMHALGPAEDAEVCQRHQWNAQGSRYGNMSVDGATGCARDLQKPSRCCGIELDAIQATCDTGMAHLMMWETMLLACATDSV